MKNNRLLFPAVILGVAMILVSCASPSSVTAPPVLPPTNTPLPPTITSTPNVCAPGNIVAQVQIVNKTSREFDDAYTLASNLTQNQVLPILQDMQRIRREAEDLAVPPCLASLHSYQLAYMDTAINLMIIFIKDANPARDPVISQGVALVNQYHNQYTLEMTRLTGWTLPAPPVLPTAPAATATP
jgi:hypothetical protein